MVTIIIPRNPCSAKDFLFCESPDWLWLPPNLLCSGYQTPLSLGIYRVGV